MIRDAIKGLIKIHERSLRLILNDYDSSFDSLLSTLLINAAQAFN